MRGAICFAIVGALCSAAGASAATPIAFGGLTAGGQGAAFFTNTADAPGDTDGVSIALKVPNSASFAAIQFLDVPPAAPATPPSFAFMPSVSGASGGSPRLVIAFDDGGTISLEALSWNAGAWSTVQGAGANWEVDGTVPGCTPGEGQTYAAALACHQADGSHVTEAYVIADGAVSGGYTVDVDDVSYASLRLTDKPGAVEGATTTLRGSFAVSLNSGRGVMLMRCSSQAGAACDVALTLRTETRHARRVGSVKGTVAANATSPVSISLNAKGRQLLRRHRRLVVIASGVVTNGGPLSTPVAGRITLVVPRFRLPAKRR
jgi:hypothetical protein